MPRMTKFIEMGNLVTKHVNIKTRQFLLDTWKDLVDTTPVKTGKARASWKISPGSPFTREIPDGIYGYPETPNLDNYKRNWTKWYISNTAPYITLLNHGHSSKAPVGFIETAINRNIIRYG